MILSSSREQYFLQIIIFFNSNLHYEANLIRLEGFGFYEILQADLPLGHSTRTKILKKQFSKLDVKSISLAYDRLDKMNS